MPGFVQALLNDDPKFRYRFKFGLLSGHISFLRMSRKFDSNHGLVFRKR